MAQEIELGKELFVESDVNLSRSIQLSEIGAMIISNRGRFNCYLVPTEEGWLLHMPLAMIPEGV
ncbi:MAG: hypothetical protein JSV56_10160 [Methanomassiliicoccales archaeon]|nr:MAG: hypothetical protein JSV56_10160 [Methanomassiliicoccales archaeon]